VAAARRAGEIAAEWRALAASALEPNVFYEPAFALAAAPAFGRNVGAGLVWSAVAPRRLLAYSPRASSAAATASRRRCWSVGLIRMRRSARRWSTVRRRGRDRRLVRSSRSHPDLPRLVLLPYFPMQDPLAEALDGVLAARGGKSAAFARHQRALLAPDGARADYLDRALGHKKRKELRRQRKRLGDAGVVSGESANEPAAVAAALGDFLSLEATGWKGRAGTAARADGDIAKSCRPRWSRLPATARRGSTAARRRADGGGHRRAQERHDGVVLEDRL